MVNSLAAELKAGYRNITNKALLGFNDYGDKSIFKLRQEYYKFQNRLSYIVRAFLKNK